MTENARRKKSGMTFETAGCEKIPFDDRFFDLITVCAAYHHFPDVRAFASEAFQAAENRRALIHSRRLLSGFAPPDPESVRTDVKSGRRKIPCAGSNHKNV